MAGDPPDLSALSLSERLTDLPKDLLPQLLIAANDRNPCLAVEKLCLVHAEWAWMCRDGQIFEVANKILGYYGKYDSLNSMRAQLRQAGDLSVWFPPCDPKVYFEEACRLLFGASEGEFVRTPYVYLTKNFTTRPYFQLLAERVVVHFPDWLDSLRATFEVTANSPERERALFHAVAKVAAQSNGSSLRHVPLDMRLLPEYEEVARLAVTETPSAIVWVPRNADWFLDLMENYAIPQKPRVILNASNLFTQNDDVLIYTRLVTEARDHARRMMDAAQSDFENNEYRDELERIRSQQEQGWINSLLYALQEPNPNQQAAELRLEDELENLQEYWERTQRDYQALDEEYELLTTP